MIKTWPPRSKLTKAGKRRQPAGYASQKQREARKERERKRAYAPRTKKTPGQGAPTEATSGDVAIAEAPAPAPLEPPRAATTEAVLRVLKPAAPEERGDIGIDPRAVLDEQARSVAQVAIWLAEPWTFVRDVFGAVPDEWQDETLHALAEATTPAGVAYFKFCLKACKGPGKTCVIAWIIWWFMLTHDQANGFACSITKENLDDNLWKELARWRNKSPMLSALFGYQSDSIYSFQHPDTWFFSARAFPKDADKSTQAQTLAGLHGKNTLLVLDEAGGIPVGVLIAGLAHHSTFDPKAEVPECHITLMAGNPDTLDGALGWACTEDSANWWVKEITGDPDDPKRAPRIDVTWAREMIRIFGRDNPWVLVNVFGKFPPAGFNKLLGPDQVRAAMKVRHLKSAWMPYQRVMALDVARSTGRDRSVLIRRQGPIIFPPLVYRIDDANDLAGQVAWEYGRWKASVIVIDMVGIGGPVADHLKALGLPVVMFNGGTPARDPRFVDRRTETWWQCAQSVKGQDGPALALPNVPELVGEATAPVLHYRPNGKMKLESKEDLLKRGVNSPDIWDAITMTFAEPTFLAEELPIQMQQAVGAGRLVTEYDPHDDGRAAVHEEDY